MYALTFDDVALVPTYNGYASRREVSTAVTSKCGKLKLDLPIMSANMDTITEYEMASYMACHGGVGVVHRFMSIEDNVTMFKRCKSLQSLGTPTFVSIGCTETELQRFGALCEVGAGYFCVDVAHAHAKYVGKMISTMRKLNPLCCIMAGNVCTIAGADYLASKGADIIKCGVGSGSVCSTRIKTGFGVPMLTAIQECSRVDRSIVADGGIRTPGDIVKALAFGADFVMLGSMLAGTAPTPGVIEYGREGGYVTDGRKSYRGMASKEVADDKLGGLTEWKTAEGVAVTVPYRSQAETDEIIADIQGGLRSGLTYSGAGTIRELQRKLQYRLVTPAGRVEATPHRLGK